jgi:WD40 repeat protein
MGRSQVRFGASLAAFLLCITTAPAGRPLTDAYGDPLPSGAVRRIGTIRLRHSADIRSLVYSSDGKTITSASENGVAVWEASTGRRVSLLSIPRYFYRAIAVSPDGSLAAYSIEGNTVRVCDARSGIVRCTLPAQDGRVDSLVFSKDNSILASTEHDRRIMVWNANTGALKRQWDAPEGSNRCHLSFTGDGKTLVHAGECCGIVQWDIASGKELKRIEPRKEKHGQYGLAVSDDGETVATICSTGQRIDIWRLKTGAFLAEVPANGASGLLFSPDSQQLVWGNQKEICFWNVSKNAMSRRMPAAVGYPCWLAWSPDGKTLASGGSDHIVHLWKLDTGKELFPAPPGQGRADSVRFLADGKTLLSAEDVNCFLLDLHGKTLRRVVIPEVDRFNVIADEGLRWIYDIAPDGSTIAVWDLDRRLLRFHDAASDKNLFDFATIAGRVDGMKFSPDGKFVLVRTSVPVDAFAESSDELLQVYKRPTPRSLEKIAQLNLGWRQFWAPQSQWVAGYSNEWKFYDAETGKLLRQFPRAFLQLSGASPSGRVTVMTAPNEKNPELWELASGKRICTLECERKRMDFFRFVFSPDGRTVATGLENVILVWNALTGKLIAKLEGHHGYINSLEFSPNGDLLLSAGYDTTILLWDCARIIPVATSRTDLTPEILNTLWHDLKANDGERGYAAVSLFVSAGAQAVPFLEGKLSPVNEDELRAIRARIQDLDNGNFKVRSEAALELVKLGEAAVPLLEEAQKRPLSLEAKRRVSALLDEIASQPASGRWLQTLRALDALEMINTADARKVISHLAKGPSEAAQAQEARRIVSRWRIRQSE